MSETSLPRGDRIHLAWLIASTVLVCAYWTAYFLSDLMKPDFVHDPSKALLTSVYLGFEGSFPLPDAFVAVTSALAAFYLVGRDPKAVLWGLVSGGAMGFLALIDIFFNLQQGLYAPAYLAGDVGMQMEVVINIGCVLGASWSIWRFWSHPLRLVR